MSNEDTADQSLYWGIDMPGLTREQAVELVSIIKSTGLDLEPILVNPAIFLTLHMDRDTVQALRSGLLGTQSDLIGDGLRESVEDWLNLTAEDLAAAPNNEHTV